MASTGAPSRASIVLILLGAAVIGFLVGALVAVTEDGVTSAPTATSPATTAPSPSVSPSATPTPTVPSDVEITLSADRASANTRELIRLTGTLSPAAGDATLQVQQSVDGIGFVDFPVEATTRSDGSFATNVRTGRVGTNEFRMVTRVDGQQVVSNAVTVQIS
jgi:hypothetical protein